MTTTPRQETSILSLYIAQPDRTPPISANLDFTYPSPVQKHGSIRTSGKFSLITGGSQELFPSEFTELHKVVGITLEKKRPHIAKGDLFFLNPSGIRSAINEGA